MGRVVNQVELSQIMGVSKQTISAWQEQGLPVAIQGVRGQSHSYDTAKVIRWYAARVSGKAEETQKDRLSRVQADRIELEMAVSNGELIPAAEIEPVWAGLAIAVRQSMLAIPSGLAPLLAQTDGEDEMRDLLQTAIEDALSKLTPSDEQGVAGASAEDVGEDGAAVEDVAVSVGRSKPTATRGKRATGKVPVRDDAVPA
jgi:phage terminase Nu1 subunit (DNA packaging protein)